MWTCQIKSESSLPRATDKADKGSKKWPQKHSQNIKFENFSLGRCMPPKDLPIAAAYSHVLRRACNTNVWNDYLRKKQLGMNIGPKWYRCCDTLASRQNFSAETSLDYGAILPSISPLLLKSSTQNLAKWFFLVDCVSKLHPLISSNPGLLATECLFRLKPACPLPTVPEMEPLQGWS